MSVALIKSIYNQTETVLFDLNCSIDAVLRESCEPKSPMFK